MDTGNGRFTEISEQVFNQHKVLDNARVFRKGEIVNIKGSRFRVQKIKSRALHLFLLPDGDLPSDEEKR